MEEFDHFMQQIVTGLGRGLGYTVVIFLALAVYSYLG